MLSNTNESGVIRGHHWRIQGGARDAYPPGSKFPPQENLDPPLVNGILTTHCAVGIRSTIVGITDLVTCSRVTNFRFGHVSGTQHATITSGSKVSSITDYKMAQTDILIINIP